MKSPNTAACGSPEIVHGCGSWVHTGDGRALIDLASGFGAVFLGHAHPEVVASVQGQLERIWSGSCYPTAAQTEAGALLASLLPAGLKPGGIYSTGMEAIEFAMRVAVSHTGRREFAGFARSMHGKSAFTAALCWDNALVGAGQAHVLPFIGDRSEAEALEGLATLLSSHRLAAVFIEPIQGSNGCLEASAQFYEQAMTLCRDHGTLCVFDEILTGLYRTGSRFYVDRLSTQPDMVIFAKCMGNGFPVSSLAIGEHIQVPPTALPGSTFAGNPLAAAATAATLRLMQSLPMPLLVKAVEAVVRERLAPCLEFGIHLRGRGALWALQLGPRVAMAPLVHTLRDHGVLVSMHDRYIRLLPAATIAPDLLADACDRIASACIAAQTAETFV